VDIEIFRDAMNKLTEKILRLQGDGDYAGVGKFYEDYGEISPTLRSDIARLKSRGIPVDVVFGK
jgi:hypothetical protein